MEHEAEKYQQRLQAIAEKRRLQEEQERVRREKEDERMRIQQLKRKSLRDQWLMEGPPTSPDSAGPRSPLWGSKAQEIETNINKLQVKSEQLAEEQDKLQKFIDDGSDRSGPDTQTQQQGEALLEALETVAEMTPNGPIVENGQEEKKDDSVDVEKHEAEKAEDLELVTDAQMETETTASSAVVNGNAKEETSDNTAGQDQPASVNGFNSHPADGAGAAGVTMTFLGFKEVEPGQGVDEDDDGGAVIRAERVIITDEGEEVPEEEEPTTDPKNEDTSESTEAAGSEEETENQQEASADPEDAEVSEDSPAGEIVVEVEVEGEEKMEELPNSIETQSQNLTVNTEASQVPQPSPTIRPKHTENTTESHTPNDEVAMGSTRISLSQFQDVPLDESNTKAETEKQGVEQEPLLVSKTAAQLDTSAPTRAEDTGPKRKTCQCCSVM